MARILPFQRTMPVPVCRKAQCGPDFDSHTGRTPDDDEIATLSFPEAWRPFIRRPERHATVTPLTASVAPLSLIFPAWSPGRSER